MEDKKETLPEVNRAVHSFLSLIRVFKYKLWRQMYQIPNFTTQGVHINGDGEAILNSVVCS